MAGMSDFEDSNFVVDPDAPWELSDEEINMILRKVKFDSESDSD